MERLDVGEHAGRVGVDVTRTAVLYVLCRCGYSSYNGKRIIFKNSRKKTHPQFFMSCQILCPNLYKLKAPNHR